MKAPARSRLRAEFPNPSACLLPGMYVRARLEQAVNEKAISVPQQAVTRSADGASVMVVGADDKVAARPVKTGSAQGDAWLINEGLQGRRPGDRRRAAKNQAGRHRQGRAVAAESGRYRQLQHPLRAARQRSKERYSCSGCQPQKRNKEHRMGKFFIDRPVFAWVLAIFIMLAGDAGHHAIADLAISEHRAAVHRGHRRPIRAPPPRLWTTASPA